MSEIGVVKGFKVLNPDWTCKNKQYGCPGRFEEDVTPSVCNEGMHFCKKAADCFNYYRFDPENKVAEVVAYGTVAEDGDKCCTDKLEIVREIPWAEVLEIVNMGKGCTDFVTAAIGTAAIVTAAIGTSVAFPMDASTPQARKFTCSISLLNGLMKIG